MTSPVFQPEPYAAAKKSENKSKIALKHSYLEMRICLLVLSFRPIMRKLKYTYATQWEKQGDLCFREDT